MFKFIKNNIAPFLAGIFFTLFIIMVIFVVYLYNENAGLKRDIDNIRKQLVNIETRNLSDGLNEPAAAETTQNVDTPATSYFVPNDSPNFVNSKPIGSNDPNNNPSYSKDYSAKDVPQTVIEQKEKTTIENSDNTELIYFSDKWAKLRKNMTRTEVKNLIGMPSQVVSFIDSSTYLYNYSNGDGTITFSRFNRVIGWKKPY